MIEQRYTLPAIKRATIADNFTEAYLEFYGLNHLRPSYTAWVFLSSKLPKKVTPNSRGYAGTFAVFGHAQCWGEAGHCHGVDGIRRFDSRPSHPMTPAFKRVPISHALKRYMEGNRKEIIISLYAYSREKWPDHKKESLICCSGVQLVTL